MLKVLLGSETRVIVFAPGCLAEFALYALKAVAEEGHEIAAHVYSQDLIPA